MLGTVDRMVRSLGRATVGLAVEAGGMGLLLARVLMALFPPRVDAREAIVSAERFGYRSVPIVVMTAFFTGGIMTLQALPYAQEMQAISLLPWAASFTAVREVAPVLIGLMFSGRVGSNNTAELGTMAVTEQVDAMRLLALDPYELLVVPRVLAMVFMMVLLVIIGDMFSVAGAALTARFMTELELSTFVSLMRGQVLIRDFLSGVVKAASFGLAIGVISCHYGLRTRGGARGVGRAVNASVVGSALGIIILDDIVTTLLR